MPVCEGVQKGEPLINADERKSKSMNHKDHEEHKGLRIRRKKSFVLLVSLLVFSVIGRS